MTAYNLSLITIIHFVNLENSRSRALAVQTTAQSHILNGVRWSVGHTRCHMLCTFCAACVGTTFMSRSLQRPIVDMRRNTVYKQQARVSIVTFMLFVSGPPPPVISAPANGTVYHTEHGKNGRTDSLTGIHSQTDRQIVRQRERQTG